LLPALLCRASLQSLREAERQGYHGSLHERPLPRMLPESLPPSGELMANTVKQENGKFVVYVDDLKYSDYPTEQQAIAVKDEFDRDDEIADFAANQILNVIDEVMQKFEVSRDKAMQILRGCL
jgi:hypothetical protein